MSQINDQAAKEATELLPCSSLVACNDDGHGGGCVYWFRPAVAERLRQRDAQLREALDVLKLRSERIAALEKDVKDLTADVSSRGETIIALEAENEVLLKHVDDAQNEAGALIRENERLRATYNIFIDAAEAYAKAIAHIGEDNAALAGRGK